MERQALVLSTTRGGGRSLELTREDAAALAPVLARFGETGRVGGDEDSARVAAGVRAGLARAAAKIEERAAEWDKSAQESERVRLPGLAQDARDYAEMLREEAAALRAIDPESVVPLDAESVAPEGEKS